MKLSNNYRCATIEDAKSLAELVNMAGEGLPYYLWTQLAENTQSPWDIGKERAMREQGGFSYKNAIVRDEDQSVVCCLIGYPITEKLSPEDYGEIPGMFVPLQKLEDCAVASWYINVLATYSQHRMKGYGSEMLKIAEGLATENKLDRLSLIVANANTDAIRFYEKHHFKQADSREMIREGWETPSNEWLLMIKNIS